MHYDKTSTHWGEINSRHIIQDQKECSIKTLIRGFRWRFLQLRLYIHCDFLRGSGMMVHLWFVESAQGAKTALD